MLLLTLRGTPTIYYGEEIGKNVPIVPGRFRIRLRKMSRAWDWGVIPRTPMPRDAFPGTGFTSGETWLQLLRRVQSIADSGGVERQLSECKPISHSGRAGNFISPEALGPRHSRDRRRTNNADGKPSSKYGSDPICAVASRAHSLTSVNECAASEDAVTPSRLRLIR
jgi:hypothetical protein